ncbi:MAG: hypothetical protein SFT81_03180 [Candidatus Caenarcaniphilales bacterium]|nr:hypothetical protein [Candidatus Caenarcaniphilales bacterium]
MSKSFALLISFALLTQAALAYNRDLVGASHFDGNSGKLRLALLGFGKKNNSKKTDSGAASTTKTSIQSTDKEEAVKNTSGTNSNQKLTDDPKNQKDDNTITSQSESDSPLEALEDRQALEVPHSKPPQEKATEQDDSLVAPVAIEGTKPANNDDISENEPQPNQLEKANQELNLITKDRKKTADKTIDAINFIQPSLALTPDDKARIDQALTRAEQEQLIILWRATLERNKTIHFIVEKLAPDNQNKKKNQVLAQVLNTAVFLPLYAVQTVAPSNVGNLASYLGAGLVSDLINGTATRNADKLALSQTEMVIMFMMIDQVAERVRTQYHIYKQEKVDYALAVNDLEETRQEASGALDTKNSSAMFLAQVRIRQLEREVRRIDYRLRATRIILADLSGIEAINQIDALLDKELQAVLLSPVTVEVAKQN